jgi:hypothetical protein
VDGAVLLDLDARPRGFSTFFNGEPPRNLSEQRGTAKVQRTAENLGGGRHRSAAAFCAAFAPAAALVVSSDGRMTMLWATQRDHVTYISFGELGPGFSD